MAHISTCGSSLGPLCWPCSVAQMSSSTLRPGPQQWKSRCVDLQGAPPTAQGLSPLHTLNRGPSPGALLSLMMK